MRKGDLDIIYAAGPLISSPSLEIHTQVHRNYLRKDISRMTVPSEFAHIQYWMVLITMIQLQKNKNGNIVTEHDRNKRFIYMEAICLHMYKNNCVMHSATSQAMLLPKWLCLMLDNIEISCHGFQTWIHSNHLFLTSRQN